MDSKTRLSATKTIWVAYFFILVAVNGNVMFAEAMWSDFNMVATLVISLVALLSTGMIWNWGSLPHTQANPEDTRPHQKGKRVDRVGMVLDLLGEDELDSLRRRLENDQDGEMVDFGALLDNDGEIARRK